MKAEVETTTPAEAVAQWCEANGWTKNPEVIPVGTRFVNILDGEVYFDGTATFAKRPTYEQGSQIYYADLPTLPTELGSLIVDVTTKAGNHYSHLLFDGSYWAGYTDRRGWVSNIDPEHIVSWHPGKAVRADEQGGEA